MQETFTIILSQKKVTYVLYLVLLLCTLYIGVGGWQYISGRQSTQQVQETNTDFNTANPIIKHIPYRNSFYSISYDRLTESNSIKIKVFSKSPYYRYQALDYLLKYDQMVTIKYEIEFVDYVSPLQQEGQEL